MPAWPRFGVGMLPCFPLAGGMLTGKYRHGQPAPAGARLSTASEAERFLHDENLALVDRLCDFAAERGLSLLDVAIGGLAAQPGVTSVIAGANSPEQIAANVAAGGYQPSADDLATIDRLRPPGKLPAL